MFSRQTTAWSVVTPWLPCSSLTCLARHQRTGDWWPSTCHLPPQSILYLPYRDQYDRHWPGTLPTGGHFNRIILTYWYLGISPLQDGLLVYIILSESQWQVAGGASNRPCIILYLAQMWLQSWVRRGLRAPHSVRALALWLAGRLGQTIYQSSQIHRVTVIVIVTVHNTIFLAWLCSQLQ